MYWHLTISFVSVGEVIINCSVPIVITSIPDVPVPPENVSVLATAIDQLPCFDSRSLDLTKVKLKKI